MDLTLPNGLIFTVEYEDRGAHVYGIQRALNRCGLFKKALTLDGVYGDETKRRVEQFQKKLSLGVDGRFGPNTSKTMSVLLQQNTLVEQDKDVPEGITYSIVSLESGDLIAANNWSVAGGVDLCYSQRRVWGPPFEGADIMRAFDAVYQFKWLINNLRSRFDAFWTANNAVDTKEQAWRLAVLNHNYPSAAAKIAEVGVSGLSSYWTTTQSWVTPHNRKFADGSPVTTPLQWCQHYALGAPAHGHEGVAVRGVVNWNVS